MEVHQRMLTEPAVVFGLVGVEIVEDDVELPPVVACHERIHEVQKVAPAAPPVVARGDEARGDFQRGKERRRAMPLVAVGGFFRDLRG